MTKATPIISESTTSDESTRRKSNIKFKRKESLTSNPESSGYTTPSRGHVRNRTIIQKPRRKRRMSVSNFILERKRRNSFRSRTGTKVEKHKTEFVERRKRIDKNESIERRKSNKIETSERMKNVIVKSPKPTGEIDTKKKYVERKSKRKHRTSINEDDEGVTKRTKTISTNKKVKEKCREDVRNKEKRLKEMEQSRISIDVNALHETYVTPMKSNQSSACKANQGSNAKTCSNSKTISNQSCNSKPIHNQNSSSKQGSTSKSTPSSKTSCNQGSTSKLCQSSNSKSTPSSKTSCNQGSTSKPCQCSTSKSTPNSKTSCNQGSTSKPCQCSTSKSTPSFKTSCNQGSTSKPCQGSTSKSTPSFKTSCNQGSTSKSCQCSNSKSMPSSKTSCNQGSTSKLCLGSASKSSSVLGGKAETLLEKDFSEDSSDDEEYKPNEDELNELDDTLGEKSVTEEVELEVGEEVAEEQTMLPPDGAPYMTRSKVSYTDQALEDIEQAFIPPDIDLDMYDSVIDDQDWKDFLTEFTKPIDKINTNEDDDTEFIPNLQEEEHIDSEEFRRDPGVKVSKKELNELMGELFDFNEIYDHDGGEENVDNINDLVNLKFNETIHDVSVNTPNKATPKKVTFVDTSAEVAKQVPNRKQTESKENSGKGKRKMTPDKGKTKSTALSEDINKQIMDEINKEINKYIQINETYVYKGGPAEDVTENYDNYEEYIVIIGNQEPSAKEINKLAQVKMEESAKSAEAKGNLENVKTDDCDLENTDNDKITPSKDPSQPELSVKLVQKTMLSKASKASKKKVEKPPKPVKNKKQLLTDINYNYGKISQRQYKEIYEAYVKAIQLYKDNYGETQEELAYHRSVVNYGAHLYKMECNRLGLTSSCSQSETSVIFITDNMNEIQNIETETENPTFSTSQTTSRRSKTDDATAAHAESQTKDNPINRELTEECDEGHARIKTENIHLDEQDLNENVPADTPIQTERLYSETSYHNLFDEEDLNLLQQQINQHIQYCLQHYLQTYNHPRLCHHSTQAKHMIQTFHTLSQHKEENSFFNALNIEDAANLVNTWETLHQNATFKSHIDQEWSVCVSLWRSYTDTLTLPQAVINTILDNEAFIYPVLLPKKAFEPKPRKLVNPLEMNCELNLAVLGFINYAYILDQSTNFERYRLIHDVIVAIQKNYLPAHTVKHLAKKIYDLIWSPNGNILQEFFQNGRIEELHHFIIDYNEENVVAPRRQHCQLLPSAWQYCVRQSRRRNC